MAWMEDAVLHQFENLNNRVLPLQDILHEIPHQLETFLQSEENDKFIFENGYVAVRDESLKTGRQEAVEYFKEKLGLYEESPHYWNFRGHVGQAEEEVVDFMNTFYPGNEFKNFLEAHPDVFVVFDDDTVWLVENESVDYFKECLEKKGPLHFENLRGHLGQAPSHVIDFINTQYPGKSFLEFLENNSHIFDVNDGYVSLYSQDSS